MPIIPFESSSGSSKCGTLKFSASYSCSTVANDLPEALAILSDNQSPFQLGTLSVHVTFVRLISTRGTTRRCFIEHSVFARHLRSSDLQCKWNEEDSTYTSHVGNNISIAWLYARSRGTCANVQCALIPTEQVATAAEYCASEIRDK